MLAKQNEDTCQVNEAEIIARMIFMANDDAAKIPKPSE